MNIIKYVASGLTLALIATTSQAAEPSWFQSKAGSCVLSNHKWIDANDPTQGAFRKDLGLQKAEGGSVSAEIKGVSLGGSFPGIGLDKRMMPGAGFCCIYDQAGNEIDAKPVLKGNDECWQRLKLIQDDAWRSITLQSAGGLTQLITQRAAKRYVAGLYWCVGLTANCYIDWWFKDAPPVIGK